MDDDAYAALIRSVGEASLRDDAWDDVLERLAEFAGARGVAFIPMSGGVQGLRQTRSLDELADAYVHGGWATRDLRYRGMPKMLAGQVSVDSDFIAYDKLRREPFYEDFLRPLGFRHYAGMALRNGDDAWAVALQRGVDDEPYSPEEQARLATLIEPMQAAVRVGQLINHAYHQGALDRMDASGTACVLLNRVGLVAHMNRAAEAMLGTALAVRQGFIRLTSRDLTSRLHTRIQQALSTPSPATAAPLPPLVARGPHGMFVFEAMRLPNMEAGVLGRYRCMVLIHPTGGQSPLNLEAFRSMFDLSRQEAAVCGAMMRSRSLVEAAKDLGISHETARSRIKTICAKTGTRSQAELISLVGELRLVGR